jgi:hypothetical protein
MPEAHCPINDRDRRETEEPKPDDIMLASAWRVS